jgi:NAD(P)-dependent dehydrogenase (short-subunit alcohol dehydrogenase family)
MADSTSGDRSLDGRTAIVTGAASGIGRGIARALAAKGANVAVADIRETPKKEGAAPTQEIVESEGSDALFVETDVSEEVDVATMVERTTETFGGLDILVNNAAAASRYASIEDLPLQEWQHVLDVTLTGVYLCSREALPHLRETDAPRIVNVASQLGFVGIAGRPAYCAAKAGVVNFTRQLAVEYGDVPVLANTVCPGLIRTPRTEELWDDAETMADYDDQVLVPYYGEPRDVGTMAAFLASDDARYITGSSFVVDGGYLAH